MLRKRALVTVGVAATLTTMGHGTANAGSVANANGARPDDATAGLAIVFAKSGDELASRHIASPRSGPRRAIRCYYSDIVHVPGMRADADLYGDGKARGDLADPLVDGTQYIFECDDVTDRDKPTPVKVSGNSTVAYVTYQTADPGAPLADLPLVKIQEAIENLRVEEYVQVPQPDVVLNPAGDQIIGIPTWFHVTNALTDTTKRVLLAGIAGTVTVRPRHDRSMVITPFPGASAQQIVSCDAPGPEWQPGMSDTASHCSYTYWDLPANRTGGKGTFAATVTVYYEASWDVPELGLGGNIPDLVPSREVPVTVKGLQAVGR
jgi:hypothetical protein